ncbi:MAG: insulinase family protein [Candidatus Omnitrophica bacterium]|nr:insulinase family protein [Candidatus Omnitrophota bacterium]
MYERINLNNGLRVILNHMPHMASSAIGVWIAVGSRDEKADVSGISHFLEHMVFKGTPSRSSRKIKEDIEGRGGSLNGFTSEEMTCYLAKVSSVHIDNALDVISDMALHAHMDEDDIRRERNVIIEEIKMYLDLPNHHVYDILSGLMWPRHPLGISIAGTIKSVNSITRKDLLDYKNKNYIPKNIVVVLCGNFNRDAILGRINKMFSENVKSRPPHFVEFSNSQRTPQIKVFYKATEQSHLSMGMHTFGSTHKDRYILGLLHIILGANMSSRLFENVREKRGLAYEIGTEIKKYKETGAFIINAGIEHKKVKEAVKVIIQELRKIASKPVLKKELAMAKEFFKVQLLLALEETLSHMLWLGEKVISQDELPDKSDIIKKMDSVSGSDLQRVAKSIFIDKNLNLALVGPVKDKEAKEIERELNSL